MLSHLCILYLDFYLYLVYTLHMYHLYLYLIYVAFQHQIVVKLILKLNISIPGQEQFPSDGARRSFSSKVTTKPQFLTHCWLLVADKRIKVEATRLQSLIFQGWRRRWVKVFFVIWWSETYLTQSENLHSSQSDLVILSWQFVLFLFLIFPY